MGWNEHYPALTATELYVTGTPSWNADGNDRIRIGYDPGNSSGKFDDTLTITDSRQGAAVDDPGPFYSQAFTQCAVQGADSVTCQLDQVIEINVWGFHDHDVIDAKPLWYLPNEPELPIQLSVYGHAGGDVVRGGRSRVRLRLEVSNLIRWRGDVVEGQTLITVTSPNVEKPAS